MNEFIDMCLTSTVALIALAIIGAFAYIIVTFGPAIAKFIIGTINWNIDRWRE